MRPLIRTVYRHNMQSTETVDAPDASADAPRRVRIEVIDALFASRKNIVRKDGRPAPTAQARALSLHKSHWFRIRNGKVIPHVDLMTDIAEFLGTSVGSIYGRDQ